MSEAKEFKYKAFLSYSHKDTRWAVWLHRRLEGFALGRELIGRQTEFGKVPDTLRPVFRDREEFTGGDALADATVASLDDSAALVVLCSPAAAASHNVNEEVRLFRWRHPGRPVVPVIVDGDAPSCFPPALAHHIGPNGEVTDHPITILGTDLRDAGDGQSLGLAKVIAGVTGLGTDDVYRRAERVRRQESRTKAAIAASLLLLSAVGGYYFWQSETQKEVIASQQAERASALRIAQQLLGTNPAAAAVPGQEENLVSALEAIQQSVEAGDKDYTRAFALLKEGKGAEAVPLLIQAAEAKKKRSSKESKDAAKAFREAAAIASVAEPWRVRELYAEAARLDPDDVNGLFQNAQFQKQAGNINVAEVGYTRVIQKGVAGTDDNNLYWARLGLGDIQQLRGKLADSERTYREAAKVAEQLVETRKNKSFWRLNLSASHERIGDVLVKLGKLDDALTTFREGYVIREKLLEENKNNIRLKRVVSISNERLGDIYKEKGNLEAALKEYRASLARMVPVRDADPKNTDFQRFTTVTLNKVGNVLLAQNKLEEALKTYKESLGIIKKLADADLDNAGWQRDLSISYNKIGDVLIQQGKQPEALKNFKLDLEIAERLARTDPKNAVWQRDLWVSYWRLAKYEPKVYWPKVVAKLEDMQSKGILQPTDQTYLTRARKQLDELK